MATYVKGADGALVRQGVRAIKTARGVERIASLWVKTAAGPMKVYEAVRSCFGSGRWVGKKPWVGKERWKGATK